MQMEYDPRYIFSRSEANLVSMLEEIRLPPKLDIAKVGQTSLTTMSPILPKNSPLIKPMNIGLLKLREKGHLPLIYKRHLKEVPRLSSLTNNGGKTVLTLNAAAAVFLVYGAALVLALILLGLEIAWRQLFSG